MTFAEVLEIAGSEWAINALKLVGTALSGGSLVMFTQWMCTLIFGSGAEVKSIINAMQNSDLEIEILTTPTQDADGKTITLARKVARISATNISVDPLAKLPRKPWWGSPPICYGVIYNGKTDVSYLYTRSELTAMMKAAKNRIYEMTMAERDEGRRKLAEQVPIKKKGKA